MSAHSAFHRGVHPLLDLLLAGKEEAVLAVEHDHAVRARIDELAGKCTEGELTREERAEYEGYVRANKFIAILRREARARKAAASS